MNQGEQMMMAATISYWAGVAFKLAILVSLIVIAWKIA